MKDKLSEELERVFDKSPNYHTKILSGDLNAKISREDKPTVRNVSLREIIVMIKELE
jgi:hypothetical protein